MLIFPFTTYKLTYIESHHNVSISSPINSLSRSYKIITTIKKHQRDTALMLRQILKTVENRNLCWSLKRIGILTWMRAVVHTPWLRVFNHLQVIQRDDQFQRLLSSICLYTEAYKTQPVSKQQRSLTVKCILYRAAKTLYEIVPQSLHSLPPPLSLPCINLASTKQLFVPKDSVHNYITCGLQMTEKNVRTDQCDDWDMKPQGVG